MSRIAITGASGFLGTHLQAHLRELGHTPVPVVRSQAADGEIRWSIEERTVDLDALATTDAVIHLAGEPIVGVRWTEAKKRRILDSRRDGTSLIAESMAALDDGPKILVSASGVNYYGARGDEIVDESSAPGEGFLADVTREWESAADPAREASIRVVHPRQGVVLDKGGGALAKMLPAFRLGVGGPLGDGTQWFPWIALEDALRALVFCLEHDALEGPVNVVSPEAVTNAQFTKALGAVLNRPAALRLPAFAVKLGMGKMGEETLLTGVHVHPRKLIETGFSWKYPRIQEALEATLMGRGPSGPRG